MELTADIINGILIFIILSLQLIGLAVAVALDPNLDKKRRLIMLTLFLLSFTLVLQNYAEYVFVEFVFAPGWRTFVAAFGYSIRPAIIVLFVCMISPDRKHLWAWALVGFNLVMYNTAYFSHVVFYISGDNSWIGAPFILFNDSDDISHPRRLELVRKAFEDDSVNVVYMSFDVIDENDRVVANDKITASVREIVDGHKTAVVEGECAWAQIAAKKKYTNLTSCTAVRTSLAVKEPFPDASVSEDCHTWLRYGAHPGKFVFLREIKGRYRVCSGVQSRSRSQHADFYEQMFKSDSAGFEEAVKIAKAYGTMGGWDEDEIRTAFYVRLALNLLNGGIKEFCKKSLRVALDISREKTLEYIDKLPCDFERKAEMKALTI